MKRISILSVFLIFSIGSYSDSKITRGPNIGEIYFIGPTHTGLGLYHSIDYGQNAICVDSTFTTNIMSICADKTEGVVYYVTMQEGLYISYDYGHMGTWDFRSEGIKIFLNSGRNDGEIYSSISKKSTDYGQTFYYNSCNGYFGNGIDSEIDNLQNHGYSCVYSIYDPDTLFLLYSDDDFENLQIQKKFTNVLFNDIEMSRGNCDGEIYINLKQYDFSINWLLKSYNFGQSFDTIDGLNLTNYYHFDLVGGRQEGEIYLLYSFVNQLWLNAQTYIYHSTDFGKTFEVFHPFAKGNEPLLANFSATEKELPITSSVDFSNFSIGDIQEYQWDFDNDGIIDSYDRIPVYTYADTGWYSVKLTIVGADSSNSFVKQNYIHVIDTTTGINEMQLNEFTIAPNPFMAQLTLTSNVRNESYSVFIYSLKGEKVFETIEVNNMSFTINTSEFDTGVYILNVVNQNNSANYKIIKK